MRQKLNSAQLGNNLTEYFQSSHQSSNPVTQYLWQLNAFSGQFISVPANQTGVTITFQNLTFQGIHVAKFLYKIVVSRSAESASYMLVFPCVRPGLVLTVGSIPYAGPLAYGEIQLSAIIINNAIALVGATIISIILRSYWQPRARRFDKERALHKA